MRIDNSGDNRQSEASASAPRRVEHGGEGAVSLLFAHTLPGVLELEQNECRLGSASRIANPPRSNSQSAATRHRFGRVQNQIQERLFQLSGLAEHARQCFLQVMQQLDSLIL